MLSFFSIEMRKKGERRSLKVKRGRWTGKPGRKEKKSQEKQLWHYSANSPFLSSWAWVEIKAVSKGTSSPQKAANTQGEKMLISSYYVYAKQN